MSLFVLSSPFEKSGCAKQRPGPLSPKDQKIFNILSLIDQLSVSNVNHGIYEKIVETFSSDPFTRSFLLAHFIFVQFVYAIPPLLEEQSFYFKKFLKISEQITDDQWKQKCKSIVVFEIIHRKSIALISMKDPSQRIGVLALSIFELREKYLPQGSQFSQCLQEKYLFRGYRTDRIWEDLNSALAVVRTALERAEEEGAPPAKSILINMINLPRQNV